MNPPAALQSAMNRERKPFTYLPGGLDLSEIKSQRMAQRLMRNAMNPGVSEQPSQPPSGSTTPATAIPVPNFNCLPVQVFPTFQLPANPKSLLRTRSNPDPKMPSFLNLKSNSVNTQFEVNKPAFPQSQVNNGTLNSPKRDVCFENNSNPLQVDHNDFFEDGGCGYLPKMEYITEYHKAKPPQDLRNIILPSAYLENSCKIVDNNITKIPSEPHAAETRNITSPPLLMTLDEDATNNEQKETKTVKESTKKTTAIQNGEQNGKTDAAVTVKLPSKKSEAQSETKVEVVKKTLPDGSVQEITTTTTTTTVDGRTEIKTRTQTKTFPKEVVEEVDESEEEVEQENETKEDESLENDGRNTSVITNEERSESTQTTTKKVTVVEKKSNEDFHKSEASKDKESDAIKDSGEQTSSNVEIEEVEEDDDVEEISEPQENTEVVKTLEQDDAEVVEETQDTKEDIGENEKKPAEQNKDESESEYEEVEEKDNVEVVKSEPEKTDSSAQNEDDSEYTEEEYESEVEEEKKIIEKVEKTESTKDVNKTLEKGEEDTQSLESEPILEKQEVDEQIDSKNSSQEEAKPESKEEEATVETEKTNSAEKLEESPQTETKSEEVHEIKVEVQKDAQEEKLSRPKVQFREPSVPLEKVEDVEIKPITGQDFVTKSTVEKTEIITSSNEQPTGILSKQTNYNRIENIVTVNRTTKTLDKQLDDLVHPTYLTGSNFTSPQVSKPYQPTYTPEPTTERRHSLLLERLSVDRQLPVTEIYQHPYSSQSSEHKEWSEEPRTEVLTINNVKPSAITKNQQWYQYSKENVSSHNYQTDQSTYQPWNQQPQKQVQSQYKPPQPQYQSAQPQYTPSQATYQTPQQQYVPPQQQYQPTSPHYQAPQPQYAPKPQQYQQQPLFHRQASPQPQPAYQTEPQYTPQPPPQYQYQPQPLNKPEQTYQPSFTENRHQETKSTSTFSPNVQRNTFTPKPDWNSNTSSQNYNQTSQYTESTDFYAPKSYGSSYVPPPWEQDSKYATDSTFGNYEPLPVSGISPTPNQSWVPTPKPIKFSKATPKAYIPPAPNQSFVKPVTATPPKVAGRKTYYSEYERRYISVPESTYVPNETKFQHQPDPSPVYYYNTEETMEATEPEWRKELREFTEKTTKTQTHVESSVIPPWEEEKTAKSAAYTPTPTWSQTLQPRSHRERSFESERYSSVQEWPKTNTIGRGRPLSTYEKSEYESPVQRVRGVSMDRYNPSSYQSPSPAEHPPVQSQTLTAENAPQKHYNPNVPAYHASRASAEPRDVPASYKPTRLPVDSRTPFQSRSFKYLQWITGTED